MPDQPIDWEARAKRFAQLLAVRSRVGQSVLDEAIRAVKEAAWDEGFDARSQEDLKQRADPSHPITRTNPYQAEGTPDA